MQTDLHGFCCTLILPKEFPSGEGVRLSRQRSGRGWLRRTIFEKKSVGAAGELTHPDSARKVRSKPPLLIEGNYSYWNWDWQAWPKVYVIAVLESPLRRRGTVVFLFWQQP